MDLFNKIWTKGAIQIDKSQTAQHFGNQLSKINFLGKELIIEIKMTQDEITR